MFESSLNRPHTPSVCQAGFHSWNTARSRILSTSKMCPTFRKLKVLDGDPIDTDWKIFPRAKTLDTLHKIQAHLQGRNITPEKFSDRKIFMSMFHDIELEKKDFEDSCALTSRKIKEYGTRRRKQWYQAYATKNGGKWDLRASQSW